jgi:hypothetical protein
MRYSSYSFSTSSLDGVSGQRHAPAALEPRVKDPLYSLDRRLGGPQSWKNPLLLSGIEPRPPRRPVCSRTIYSQLPQLLRVGVYLKKARRNPRWRAGWRCHLSRWRADCDSQRSPGQDTQCINLPPGGTGSAFHGTPGTRRMAPTGKLSAAFVGVDRGSCEGGIWDQGETTVQVCYRGKERDWFSVRLWVCGARM